MHATITLGFVCKLNISRYLYYKEVIEGKIDGLLRDPTM